MPNKIIYNHDNPNNFVFSSDKIEVVNPAQLVVQQIGAEAYMYAKLDENQGLVAIDSSGNNRHGAFQGGLDETYWTTGKINNAIHGVNTSQGFINFNGIASFERTNAFSLEFWIKYNSTATQHVVSKQDSTVFTGYGVVLLAGKIRATIRDDLSNIISLETVGSYNDGNWHHVAMTYDGSSGISGFDLYVDNVSNNTVVASDTLSGTIITTVDFQISGRDGNNNCLDTTTSVDEVLVYERELTPAEISFRWNSGNGTQQIPGATTAYPTDNPSLQPKGPICAVSSLVDFDATVVEPGNDEIRFAIIINGIETYWNGSAWVSSAGYPENNTIAEIKANISSINIVGIVAIGYKAYFHSDDGSTTPQLFDVSFEYNSSETADDVTKCIVWGINRKTTNDDFDDSAFVIRLSQDAVKYLSNIMRDDEIIITPDINTGYWEIALVETATMPDSVYYEFIFETDTNKTPSKTIIKKDVPAVTTLNFWSLPDAI